MGKIILTILHPVPIVWDKVNPIVWDKVNPIVWDIENITRVPVGDDLSYNEWFLKRI